MVINAIEMKLLMVKTVAQCVKLKTNQKFSPTTNLCIGVINKLNQMVPAK